MGSSEMEKSSKDTKEAKESKTPTLQEQASSTSPGIVNPDWSGFQAYSPLPPHGFLASNPQTHPYMWGVQPIIPPYGTPPHPYVAMYPHGGIYTHPSIPPGSYPFSTFAMPSPNGIAEACGNTPGSVEVDDKPSEGKEKLPVKRSKGSLGSLNMITGKNSDPVKASAANGVCSKSAESASEGSDANSQNDSSQMRSGSRQDSLEVETSQNGSAPHGSQNGPTMIPHPMAIMPISTTSAPGGIPCPTTNLNIGMDYWGAATTSPIPAMHGKVTSAPGVGGMVPAGSREGAQSQLWTQDQRELKRQKRKQSNRESARRSRLRKQAEYDKLAQRAEALKEENATLRAEVSRIRSEYDQLFAQNTSLKERLGEVPGQDDPRSGVGNDPQQTSKP